MNQRPIRKPKIVVIGAGSSSFGLSILTEIMLTKELHGMDLTLVDINAEGLEKIRALATLMNEEWNAGLTINSTVNRREALLNADYVLISIAIDREECWRSDYEIALKYNIEHYAENGGPGGFIHAARNISMLMDIFEDINAICPRALILNMTNPMQRICTAIKKLSQNAFVGLCDQFYFGFFVLGTAFADKIGAVLKEDCRFLWNDESLDYHFKLIKKAQNYFSIKAAGINHFTWMLDIRDKKSGKDIYEEARERMRSLPVSFEPLTQQLFRIFNYIPVSGDCHISEYLPYTSNLASNAFKRYDIQMYSFAWGKQIRDSMWNDIDAILSGAKAIEDLRASYNEATTEEIAQIIASIDRDANQYLNAVNIPNEGSIANLPPDAIIEVPAVVTGKGIFGLSLGRLPETIAELCRRQIILNDLTVEAVVNGDMKSVYELFALDPMVDDLDNMKSLADEYIRTNKKYLPTFQ